MKPNYLYFFAYKAICLITGLTSIFLGYKLFLAGFLSASGDLIAERKDFKLTLKNAAPGTFFSVVGGFVICFTIIKGFSATGNSDAPPSLKI